jgi:hypothetical protein
MLTERAKSKAQQKFMGMVHAYKKGELDTSDMPVGMVDRIKAAAKSMSGAEAKKIATTKHKGLPAHVSEMHMSLEDGIAKAIKELKKAGVTEKKDCVAYCKKLGFDKAACDKVCAAVVKEDSVKEAYDIRNTTFKQFLIERTIAELS